MLWRKFQSKFREAVFGGGISLKKGFAASCPPLVRPVQRLALSNLCAQTK